jgi:DNA-directed RNA polymerase subunit N (RpoN/RPB10)
MLYMVCPTCGELLGDKQLVYTTKLKEICDKYNIDDELISRGFDNNPEFTKDRQNLIQSLFDNICCKMRVLTYVELVKLIKG